MNRTERAAAVEAVPDVLLRLDAVVARVQELTDVVARLEARLDALGVPGPAGSGEADRVGVVNPEPEEPDLDAPALAESPPTGEVAVDPRRPVPRTNEERPIAPAGSKPVDPTKPMPISRSEEARGWRG
jgi:hypothetical protein